MNIVNYPEFEPLRKEMKSLFDEMFLKMQPQISEFTFTNLYCWRNAYGFSVSMLDGFIILRSNAKRAYSFFLPAGSLDSRPIIEKILKDSKATFIRLPEKIIDSFKDDISFSVSFDRDNSDYLYKKTDLTLLKGQKYDGKRNLIKKFKSNYKYDYVKLNASNAGECFGFEERWCVVKDCNSVESLDKERSAIKEMINSFTDFNLSGAAIKVNGAICAIAIGEKLNADTFVIHVLKADYNLPGLYQVINNEFIMNEAGNFEYVNFEQDLGVEGLRNAKLSYHPFEIVKKYTLTPTN